MLYANSAQVYSLIYALLWLQDCRNVILIFSVRESGRFQGRY